MARLFHVLDYQNDRTTLLIGCHGLLYQRTSFFLTELNLVVCTLNYKASTEITAVRLKVEQNQLVGVFDEIGILFDGLKGA